MYPIPYKLLELRRHSNLSQAYVAKVFEIDVIEYMAYENGRTPLSDEITNKIISFYDIPLASLIDESVDINFDLVKKIETDPTIQIEPIKEKKKINITKKQYTIIGTVLAAVIGIFLIGSLFSKDKIDKPLNLTKDPSHLIVSNSDGYIYFNDKQLVTKGLNRNNLLSVEEYMNVVEVVMNDEITALLQRDGTLSLVGDDSKAYFEGSLDKIVDIEIGKNILLVKNSSNDLYCFSSKEGVCGVEVVNSPKVFFAFEEEYIIVDDKSNIITTNEEYKQKIERIDQVKQIVKNKDTLIVLYNDGSINVVNSANSLYDSANTFTNIKKIVLLEDALITLGEDLEVKVLSSNVAYNDAKNWNVKDIAGKKDYLVGYTAKGIVGVGNNDNNKFEVVENNEPIKLANVGNINVNITEKNVSISFDAVANADYYIVSFDGIAEYKVIGTLVSLDTTDLIDGSTYIIKIQAVSNDEKKYIASDIVESSFIFEKLEPELSPSPSPSVIPSVSPSETPEITPDPVTPEPPITDEPEVTVTPE